MPAATPEIVSLGRDHAIGIWHCFLIQIWRHGTSLDCARTVRDAAKRLAAEREGALATIIVVESGAAMPDGDTRAELARMVDDQKGRMVAAALVHEGSGFRAAAVRAVMTGMMTLAKQPFPHHVVANVADGAKWLATRERLPAGDVAEIERVVEALRAKIPG